MKSAHSNPSSTGREASAPSRKNQRSKAKEQRQPLQSRGSICKKEATAKPDAENSPDEMRANIKKQQQAARSNYRKALQFVQWMFNQHEKVTLSKILASTESVIFCKRATPRKGGLDTAAATVEIVKALAINEIIDN